jgi:hypothetical protein
VNGRPFGRSRRADILRGAQLGVSVRRAETAPRALKLTDVRRGLLEAIAAGKVRHYPSSGWKSDGRAVSGIVRECVGAGWAHEWVDDGRLQIGLTPLGEQAIGREGSESA